MNKVLIFAGFLVGMSSVSGMNSSGNGLSEKPAFEYNKSSNTLVCRNMSHEDLKKYAAELDCAINVTFDGCDLSKGIFCTNAASLTFRNCHPINCKRDVLYYVGLCDFLSDVRITIENKDE